MSIQRLLFALVFICSLASLNSALTIKPSFYINDSVSNFIYGTKGIENYFESITKPDNAIKCPFHKPFTTNG